MKVNFSWNLEVDGDNFQDCLAQLNGTIKDPDNMATCYTAEINGFKTNGHIDLQDAEPILSPDLEKDLKRIKDI